MYASLKYSSNVNQNQTTISYLMRLTIHLSASSVDMLSFSASMEMEMHWWMRQNVSKIISREFSIKSSRQATLKRSVNDGSSFSQCPEKVTTRIFSLMKVPTSTFKNNNL